MAHQIMYELPNANTLCSHGVIEIDVVKYFFKRLDPVSQTREINGHAQVRSHFPTAKLIGVYHDGKSELVLYEYISEVRGRGGMLSDIIDDSYTVACDYQPIIDMYKNAYLRTLDHSVCTAQNVFFADRVATRVQAFYSDEFIQQWSNKTVAVKGVVYTLQLDQIIEKITRFFATPHSEVSVISQGDPTEYNIGTMPILLDYDAGGRVPLLADAAVINATTAHFGDYLARKYNPAYYVRRELTDLNEPRVEDGEIVRRVTAKRKGFLNDFAMMIDTVLSRPLTPEEAHAYACYFTMKIIAVFNISTFSEHEIAYLLALVTRVFDNSSKCVTVKELTEVSV